MKSFSGAKCFNECSSRKGRHALRAEQLAGWLSGEFGKPMTYTGKTFEEAIKLKTGIVFFENYWQRDGETGNRRTGDHIDLWNKGVLSSNGSMQSWFRRTFPTIAEYFSLSDLRRSKTVLFWEIK